MEKKSDMVRRLVAEGDIKAALKIAKGFRIGITKADSNAMTLAYECMVHSRFYDSLGYDLNQKIKQGTAVLLRLYGKDEKNDLHQQILKPGAQNREIHSSRNNQGSAKVHASL